MPSLCFMPFRTKQTSSIRSWNLVFVGEIDDNQEIKSLQMIISALMKVIWSKCFSLWCSSLGQRLNLENPE